MRPLNRFVLGSFRLSSNGATDTNHGPGGLRFSIAEADFGPCVYAAAKVLPDGKIVYVGHSSVVVNSEPKSGYDVCRIRINSDQSIDTSFATGPTPFSSGVTYGDYSAQMTIAAGKDAKIVTADSCLPGGSSGFGADKFCLQRFDYLSSNCYDIDGDGVTNPLVDGLIQLRAQLGLRDNAVTDGIGIPANAPRKTWQSLRDFMVFSCGMRGL